MSNDADLLFGIDMGMSCTGVAYVNQAIGNKNIRTFQAWENRDTEDKVPTQLLYGDEKSKPIAWGFGCDPELINLHDNKLVQCFKVGLGDTTKPKEEQERIKRYFKDYLECLYNNLRDHFDTSNLNQKNWDEAVIEFYFSVPSTWNTPTNRLFRQLAIDAGFGSQDGFKVSTKLSEPLAAAAYAISEEKGILKNDDRVLIIDAGGGTVDLCFLKIDDTERLTASTTEIVPVKGTKLGSTYIDDGLADMARDSLTKLASDGHLVDSVEQTISRMRRKFQPNKHSFKKGVYKDSQIFRIRIPDIRNKVNDRSIRVLKGELEYTWGDLRELFDKQIEGITDIIDEMMDNFRLETKNKKVDHVFLSGGLGSSKYVFEMIKAHMTTRKHKTLSDALLRVSGDPQLCVCRGLLAHAERNMFQNPRARESLGIVCRMPLKAAEKHKKFKDAAKLARTPAGKRYVTWDADGVPWMNNCVEWFVRTGEQITEGKPIEKPYSESVNPNSNATERTTKFNIVSSLKSDPPHFNDPQLVQSLNTLEVDLSGVRLTQEKSRKFPWLKSESDRPAKAKFVIEATIGPTDVSFRCFDPDSRMQISESLDIQTDHVELFQPRPPQDLIVREPSPDSR